MSFFSEHCKRHSSTQSKVPAVNSGNSLLQSLHWEHPPLKQRVEEVFAFRKQHENLRGVLQAVLRDDDRSAVAEVMSHLIAVVLLSLPWVKEGGCHFSRSICPGNILATA